MTPTALADHNHGSEELRHVHTHSGEVDHLAHHLTELHHVLLHIGVVQQLRRESASRVATAISSFTSPLFLG